jgi:hypothetical protein
MGDSMEPVGERVSMVSKKTPLEHFQDKIKTARGTIISWAGNFKALKQRWRTIDEVTDEKTFKQAAELLKDIKKAKKSAKAYYTPWKQELDEAKASVILMEKVDVERLETLHESVDSSMKAWEDARKEQERVAREEAEAAARRKAEAERLAQVEALRRAAAQQPNADVRAALTKEVTSLKNTPVTPDKVTVQRFIPQVQGFWRTETHEASVDNFDELILAVADAIRDPAKSGPPREALLPNMVHLNAQAKTLTDNMSKAYPGVSAKKKTGSAAR